MQWPIQLIGFVEDSFEFEKRSVFATVVVNVFTMYKSALVYMQGKFFTYRLYHFDY